MTGILKWEEYNMEKALVLGASGGMGYSIVKELCSRGIKVVAFARTKGKLERLFGDDPNVKIFSGDIFHKKDLAEVAKGVAKVSQDADIPVIFGVLTTDSIEQAIERAGTKAGNKGYDAAVTAIEMANLFKNL